MQSRPQKHAASRVATCQRRQQLSCAPVLRVSVTSWKALSDSSAGSVPFRMVWETCATSSPSAAAS